MLWGTCKSTVSSSLSMSNRRYNDCRRYHHWSQERDSGGVNEESVYFQNDDHCRWYHHWSQERDSGGVNPLKDGGRLGDFDHNYTNSHLQQVERKLWKITDGLFRISSMTNSFQISILHVKPKKTDREEWEYWNDLSLHGSYRCFFLTIPVVSPCTLPPWGTSPSYRFPWLSISGGS